VVHEFGRQEWTPVDHYTLKSALDHAHSCLHRANEKCSEKLEWKLDKSIQFGIEEPSLGPSWL
jgi:hypothetical protein